MLAECWWWVYPQSTNLLVIIIWSAQEKKQVARNMNICCFLFFFFFSGWPCSRKLSSDVYILLFMEGDELTKWEIRLLLLTCCYSHYCKGLWMVDSLFWWFDKIRIKIYIMSFTWIMCMDIKVLMQRSYPTILWFS